MTAQEISYSPGVKSHSQNSTTHATRTQMQECLERSLTRGEHPLIDPNLIVEENQNIAKNAIAFKKTFESKLENIKNLQKGVRKTIEETYPKESNSDGACIALSVVAVIFGVIGAILLLGGISAIAGWIFVGIAGICGVGVLCTILKDVADFKNLESLKAEDIKRTEGLSTRLADIKLNEIKEKDRKIVLEHLAGIEEKLTALKNFTFPGKFWASVKEEKKNSFQKNHLAIFGFLAKEIDKNDYNFSLVNTKKLTDEEYGEYRYSVVRGGGFSVIHETMMRKIEEDVKGIKNKMENQNENRIHHISSDN